MPPRPDAPPTFIVDARPAGAGLVTKSARRRPATAPSRESGGVTFIEPRLTNIEQATDLGSVQVLKHGNLYLLTDPFGDIHPDSRGLGLYRSDTRILSCLVLRVDGVRPVMLQGSMGANYRGSIQLTNPSADRNQDDKVHPGDSVAGRTIGISRDRLIGIDGLEERVRIVNHAEHELVFPVELELGADSADIFEVRGYPRPERGTLLPIALTSTRATFRYDGLDGMRRSTHVAFSDPGQAFGATDGRARGPIAQGGSVQFSWKVRLHPGERRDLRWTIWSDTMRVGPGRTGGDSAAPTAERAILAGPAAATRTLTRSDAVILFPKPPRVSADDGASAYHAWSRGTTAISTDHELFNLTLARSLADLRLLINDGPGPDQRYVAAGVPWFTTLFGRDALIASLQSLAFRPQIAMETLAVLAAYQATEVDDWRDAEPGKILHELRIGEMAGAGELPHTPYYGSVDSTPLWLIVFGATFDWTGNRAFLDQLWPNAIAALEWIDRWGDKDGDGFVEYERRSSRGLLNQGWKDSGDAIRDRHGRGPTMPVALAEVQGYVYDAKRRMAGLASVRGDTALCERLLAEAETLRAQFEAAFWVDDQRYYAMALDGEKRHLDAIGSNAGHCLWSGIAAPSRAREVADRLMSPAMFSGWGIRTYAEGQPGYNPIGYHTGSVWPHDTSLIAAGLKRYGFDEESNKLVGHVFQAAQHFDQYRLPELFCGFDRDQSALPVPYPVACSPQAWAAGASFLFLETMLGLRPHAASGELELLHPNLPDWIGRVTLTNLRVGDASVDLLFHRWRGTTSAEVLRKIGDLSVTIRL
ncbi:MAG TPA: glycogen debranching N-terminal domain-containing protein [Patescibacteria group bacterium]|nr:glycogen debranching N-terminal domain-containing protein [Patescibacteria group bacterium]